MKGKCLKKLLVMVLGGVLVFSGCGGTNGSESSENGSSAPSSSASDTSTGIQSDGEPYEVVMSYLYYGTLSPDLQKIEDAINEISVEKINVKVSFVPLTFSDILTQQSLMISSGEKLDLILGFQQSGFLDAVNNGMVIPLDELYEKYGSTIAEVQGDSIAGGYLNGTLYGIPSIEKMARVYGMISNADLLEKYGWNKTGIVGYEELDELFAASKAGEGDGFYPLALSGSTLTTFDYLNVVDYLGADIACGGIMDNGYAGNEVTNIFATDEYMEHCKWMRRWYEAGYVNPDAVTTTETTSDMLRTGVSLGYFNYIELDMVATWTKDNTGVDGVGIQTSEKFANMGTYQGQCWMITSTCENPEATFQFLNLLYEDEDIINLLYWGIEGEHYVMAGEGVVTYPEGIDVTSVTYSQPLGLYGAVSKRYVQAPLTSDYFAERDEFNSSVTDDEKSPYIGYAFNPESVKTEYAAVSDVITQYRASLESGSVDPEETIPTFLSALESAGIEKIIEANQQQLDEWLAAQE